MATPEVARGEIHALRQVIARMEGKEHRLSDSRAAGECVSCETAGPDRGKRRRTRSPLGIPALDEALGGGLEIGGLTEIRCGETRDWGGATGFAAMLIARLQGDETKGQEVKPRPVVWIADPAARREGGEIWLPGCLGLLPGLGDEGVLPAPPLLVVRPRNQVEALWAAETAASGGDLGAVVLELRGNPGCLGLTESRRLHFRAREGRSPLFLLRQSAEAEATAAPARFLVGPAPAAPRMIAPDEPLPESLGRPALTVTLEKSRRPAPLSLILEWSSHDSRFRLRDTARDHGTPCRGTASAGPGGDTGGATDPRHLSALASDRSDHPGASGTRVAFGRAS